MWEREAGEKSCREEGKGGRSEGKEWGGGEEEREGQGGWGWRDQRASDLASASQDSHPQRA